MADYTIIVDDTHPQIIYEPADSWDADTPQSDVTFSQTVHYATAQNATFNFSFFGGREIILRGNFVGDDDALASAEYPTFKVDHSQADLQCQPEQPQNGGQFICSHNFKTTEIGNHTLTMFQGANQQFHIDYIRHGSSAQVAKEDPSAVLYVRAPNNTTPGLTLDKGWTKKELGIANDIISALGTSTPSSNATYQFVGDSFTWWSCCMPPDMSGNAANVTYSIDGGDAQSLQIGADFLQGPHCKDEKIFLQEQGLGEGNHSMTVIYQGDDSKMPLSLCGLASVPVSFERLDDPPNIPIRFGQTFDNNQPPPKSSPSAPVNSTATTISQGSNTSSPGYYPSSDSSRDSDGGSSTGTIVGVVVGAVFALLCLILVLFLLRRRRARDVESTMSFDPPNMGRRRVVSTIDLAAHDPPTRRTSIDKESILEMPPPFYRSSMTKAPFSWRSMSLRSHPRQQTAYVGSDYDNSVSSYSPRNSVQTQSYLSHSYTQSEPPRYNSSIRG